MPDDDKAQARDDIVKAPSSLAPGYHIDAKPSTDYCGNYTEELTISGHILGTESQYINGTLYKGNCEIDTIGRMDALVKGMGSKHIPYKVLVS